MKFIAKGVKLNDVNFIYVKYIHDANAEAYVVHNGNGGNVIFCICVFWNVLLIVVTKFILLGNVISCRLKQAVNVLAYVLTNVQSDGNTILCSS